MTLQALKKLEECQFCFVSICVEHCKISIEELKSNESTYENFMEGFAFPTDANLSHSDISHLQSTLDKQLKELHVKSLEFIAVEESK